jgi:hypothetical protein
MPKASTADLIFCCPSCGADMRAARRDSGSVQDCHLCGEQVRVPYNPHPVEAPGSWVSATSTEALLAADRGLRFLTIGLFLIVAEYLLLGIAYICWLQTDSPASVMRRETSSLAFVLSVVWFADLFLVFARTASRWWGYSLLEPLTQRFCSPGWMMLVRYSTLLRAAGYILIAWPWISHQSWPLQGLPAALAKVGQFAWMIGAGLEFVVLIPWYQLLRQCEDHNAARQVNRYAIWNAVGLFLGAVGVSLVSLLVIMAIRAQTSTLPHGHPSAVQLPDEIWTAAGGLVLLVAAFWLFLTILHDRLLVVLRSIIRSQLLAPPRSAQ